MAKRKAHGSFGAAAKNHAEMRKLIGVMRMDSIDNHRNELALSEGHPYWRGTPEDRERRLAIVERLIDLLLGLLDEKKEEKSGGGETKKSRTGKRGSAFSD